MEIWTIRWTVQALTDLWEAQAAKTDRPVRQEGFKREDIKNTQEEAA